MISYHCIVERQDPYGVIYTIHLQEYAESYNEAGLKAAHHAVDAKMQTEGWTIRRIEIFTQTPTLVKVVKTLADHWSLK